VLAGLEVDTTNEGKIKNVIQENKRFRNFAEKKREGNVSANLELKTDIIKWNDVDNNRDTSEVRDNYGNTSLDLPTN